MTLLRSLVDMKVMDIHVEGRFGWIKKCVQGKFPFEMSLTSHLPAVRLRMDTSQRLRKKKLR